MILLLACAAIEDLKNKVDGLTNPLVMEALFLGVEPPDSDQIDLSGTDFEQGATVTVLLADAGSVADLSNAPVSGAIVEFRSQATGIVQLSDEGDGKYAAASGDGLSYTQGAEVTLGVEMDGDPAARLVAPAEIADRIPATHTKGESLAVSTGDTELAGLLVVVLDGSNGEVTFDNSPNTIEELYEFTHGGAALAVEVPGSAFSRETVYAVGVAGLNLTTADDLTEMNTALSAFIAGKLKFYPMSTIAAP